MRYIFSTTKHTQLSTEYILVLGGIIKKNKRDNMKPIFDSTVQDILNTRLNKLEVQFNCDFLFYYGPITDSLDKPFRDLIEELKAETGSRETLFIMLNTPGGSAETVERLVKITRHHYK